MPLSARARIEVYLPDLFSLPSQELLIAFNQEFTHTFGGATLWRGLDGSYLAQDGRTVRDRINLLYTDTPFSLEENADQVSSYMAKLRQAVLDALQEEAVLVVALEVRGGDWVIGGPAFRRGLQRPGARPTSGGAAFRGCPGGAETILRKGKAPPSLRAPIRFSARCHRPNRMGLALDNSCPPGRGGETDPCKRV